VPGGTASVRAGSIGRDIFARQQAEGWGTKVIDRLAADLRRAFPEMTGISGLARAASTGSRDRGLPQLPGTCAHALRIRVILEKHVQTAAKQCPSLLSKRVSPHCLRHSCALPILRSTGDIRKVALWLGHTSTQTTEMYLRADTTTLLEVMNETPPPTLRKGRFGPPDQLIALLMADR
jgi:integrase